ncbi:MAG: peptidoglycan DD-metalloendopeptidase family protein [Clostridia bacterium]|nr:peptidoglycan DD-metalloendopeptidase family protein [Clostridia bacterium]
MKNKRFKKICIVLVITFILTVICNVLVSFAVTSSDLKQQEKQNQNEINEAKDEQQQIRNKMTAIQKEVEELNSKISNYENEILDLKDQIEDTEKNIQDAQNQLDKTQKELEEKQELLERRIVTSYKMGDTTYLDVLLNSDSLTSFLSSYYFIERMADQDNKLIEAITETKNQIEESKKVLEESKTKLEDAKKSQELKKDSLNVIKNEKNEKVGELKEEDKELQVKIEQMQAEDARIRAAIRKAEQEEEARRKEEQANSNKGNSSSNGSTTSPSVKPGGYIYPVPSAYTKITTGLYYSNGSYHGAVDFGSGGIGGQPVYAVKAGTVVLTQRLTTSYGNYVLINHHDGTYTLYAHGQQGSICVSDGQKVSQGQQIMRVGSTGNSSGDHLHFEVRLSPGGYNNRVNPMNYL